MTWTCRTMILSLFSCWGNGGMKSSWSWLWALNHAYSNHAQGSSTRGEFSSFEYGCRVWQRWDRWSESNTRSAMTSISRHGHIGSLADLMSSCYYFSFLSAFLLPMTSPDWTIPFHTYDVSGQLSPAPSVYLTGMLLFITDGIFFMVARVSCGFSPLYV